MASKRTLSDSADKSQVNFEDLIDKTLCTTEPEPEQKKPKNVIFQLLPLLRGEPVRIEPKASTSQSYDEPCSSSSVAMVPSDSKLVASLTCELDIKKEEATDGEDDIHFDDTMSDVKEEPIDEEQDFDVDEYYEKQNEEVKKEEEEDKKGGEDGKTKKKMVWTKNPSSMKTFHFTKEQKFLVPMPREPYDLFRMFLDDEILDLIVKETNRKGSKSEKSWNPITRDELLLFIGLVIHTGTISLNRLCDYWNYHYLFNIKTFARFMKRNRFLQILDYLSFSNSTTEENVRKVQPLVDHFNKKMNSIYYPGANLVLAKSITIHGGNIVWGKAESRLYRVYNTRVTRTYILVEPSGIVLKLNVTQGNVNDSIVFDLLEEKLDSGHSVYVTEEHNYLPTPIRLLSRNTYCTGPIDDFFIKPLHTALSELVTVDDLYNKNGSYYSDGIHLCRRDKKFYISSQYDGEVLHMPTPRGRISMKSKLVAMYDSVMDFDLEENLMKYYPCRQNNLNWYKKVFIHIIQLAIMNAYKFHGQLYYTQNRLYNFRLDILEKMLPITLAVQGPPVPHVLTRIEKVKMRERRARHGQITVTREVVRKECRGCRMGQRNKRTSTIYECRQCEDSPGYCEPCFERVHTTDEKVLQ